MLKIMFDDSSYTRKIGLIKNLINIRLANYDSMTQCVTQIVEKGQRRQVTGIKITDVWIGAIMWITNKVCLHDCSYGAFKH